MRVLPLARPVLLVIAALSALTARAPVRADQPLASQDHALELALARYRQLAADPALVVPELHDVIEPGATHPAVPAIRRRLAAEGDLVGGWTSPDSQEYDPALVTALQAFQRRYTLDDDGVIGRATEQALRVSLSVRAQQIERSLARVRVLAPPRADRSIVVNVPMFHLWAYDGPPLGGTPVLDSRVIVGRPATRTPTFDAIVEAVIFWPEWNVPGSIARNEIVPAARRDPSYLARASLQILDAKGSAVPVTSQSLDGLQAGQLRLRQPAGPANPLGLVKFDLPNRHDVYLHDTPAIGLFARANRALSHGCVRVQATRELARWLLEGQPEGEPEAVLAVLAGPATRRVPLVRPAHVFLVYLTAMVWPGGAVHFAPDLYKLEDDLSLDAGPTGGQSCVSETASTPGAMLKGG